LVGSRGQKGVINHFSQLTQLIFLLLLEGEKRKREKGEEKEGPKEYG